MTTQQPSELNLSEITPEDQGARYWYERYCEQRAETEHLKQRVKELEEQFESLNETLRKLSERTSKTSSQPPSSDGPRSRTGINKSHSESEAPNMIIPARRATASAGLSTPCC